RRQCAAAGHRRRHHPARHDSHAGRAGRGKAFRPHAAAGARRAGVRGARPGGRGHPAGGHARDGIRAAAGGLAVGAAAGRGARRRQLGRGALTGLVWLVAVVLALAPDVAHAAAGLDGAPMAWPWALPFVGILLSIAVGPLLLPKIWHRHYGKIAAGWAIATLVALAAVFGPAASLTALVHAVLAEYLSFIVLLFALYTVAGGILVTGNFSGTPVVNTLILATGTVLASLVGTTGAAMILIRPLLRANEKRIHKAHVVVFFIILVANIGGALSPLGDPPLFVGFLRGVDFLWPAQHLWVHTAIIAVLVLPAFFLLDSLLSRREGLLTDGSKEPVRLRIHGLVNVLLIALIVTVILVSGLWDPGIAFKIFGTSIELQDVVRDGMFILVALTSLWLTPEEHRAANGFTW